MEQINICMKSLVLVSFQFSYFIFQPVIPHPSGEDIFFFFFSFRTNLEHSWGQLKFMTKPLELKLIPQIV